MRLVNRHWNLQRSWLAIGLTPFAIALAAPLQAQVIWETVTEQQAEREQILMPMPGDSTNKPLPPQPIVWEPVQSKERNTTNESNVIVWTPVPESESIAGGSTPNSTVVWEVIPNSDSPLAPAPTSNLAEAGDDSSADDPEAPPAEVITQEAAMPPRMVPGPPPPPPIQALNRSVAFGDGLVGPDIGWRVPNGFRWSQRWFGDVALTGQGQRNAPNDPFFDNKKADATLIVHLNLLQTEHWSAAINTSIRSVNQDPNRQGGRTAIGEGASSGFRIARALGSTGGMAFGGEQVIQWDDQVDTGRNLYLMASKGWWLGHKGRSYPLLIANGGFGTGRFSHPDLQFGCVPVENKQLAGNVDNELCWSPIGTVSLVMNEWWGAFLEYRAGMSQAGISLNLTGGIPLRLTGGVIFGENNELSSSDQYRWLVQASFGF